MRRASIEVITALGVTTLAFVGLRQALGFPGASAYLPTAVLGFAAFLGLVWTAQSLWAMRSKAEPSITIDRAELRRLATIMAGVLVLVAALPVFGFFTVFAVLIPAIAWFLGYRNWRGLVFGTLLFLGPLYVLFVVFLGRPLPPEIWQRLLI